MSEPMSEHRVVVDPITRIEGHLRIEAETDAAGNITRASSAGTMVRGIEIILRGRDPRDAWAFAQRICGVCTLVHGIASVRAVEDALNYPIPPNAQLIRNLMIGAQYVHDHVMHFYHLHALDWVDVVSALKADPKATSELAQKVEPSNPKSSPGYFADVQKKLKGFVDSGQLGIFANGYWGHPAYKLPPEANLMAVAHYLEALAWQREVAKLHAIFGGKNPHPNFLVGGSPAAISVHGGAGAGGVGATAVNMVGLSAVRDIIQTMRSFVDRGLCAGHPRHRRLLQGLAQAGRGRGQFHDLRRPARPRHGRPVELSDPARASSSAANLKEIHPVDLKDASQVQEFVAHSWYDYEGGNDQGLHP